ncbi:MAG: helix-turn-helix domain-containing protein [Mycobacterium sp.]
MVGTFLLHSDDLGETEEILGTNFAEIRIGAKAAGASTKARIWRTKAGPFTVDEAHFGYDFSYDMEPPDDILLCRVRSGVIEEQLPHEHEAFGPGKVVAFGALDGVPYSGAVHRALYDIVAVGRHLLGEVAHDQSVRLTSTVPMNPDANRLLVDAIDYVRHGVVANPHAVQEPLMAGALSRYLAASVLSALPHTTCQDPGAGGRPEASPVRLRQAIAFIDDNAHTDISLADIAAAADTTSRSLRYLFRRHRDCTPMEYVRRVRLHYAHHDLEASLGAAATVSAIAHRWGFANVDRFTHHYRETYGHVPHVIGREATVAISDS